MASEVPAPATAEAPESRGGGFFAPRISTRHVATFCRQLAVLLDAGVALETIRAALSGLPLEGYRLKEKKVTRGGIAATKVDVILSDEHEHAHRRTHSGQRRAASPAENRPSRGARRL